MSSGYTISQAGPLGAVLAYGIGALVAYLVMSCLGELAVVRVLVPVWQFEEAFELVNAYSNPAGEVGFACVACGEVYEPGQTQCGNCGASLVD